MQILDSSGQAVTSWVMSAPTHMECAEPRQQNEDDSYGNACHPGRTNMLSALALLRLTTMCTLARAQQTQRRICISIGVHMASWHTCQPKGPYCSPEQVSYACTDLSHI
jgi:hypothetical protein